MRYLLPFILVLFFTPAVHAQAAGDARTLAELKQAVEPCQEMKLTNLAEQIFEVSRQPTPRMGPVVAYAYRRVAKALWLIRVDHNASGHSELYSGHEYLIDSTRCAWVQLVWSTKAREPTSTMEFSRVGMSPLTTRDRLLGELKYEIGSTSKPDHGLARYVLRGKLDGLEGWPIRQVVDEAEWIQGKPSPQPQTYWPERQISVMAISRMVLWKKAGRYDFYRYDGRDGFLEHRSAIALYDRDRDRHVWVLPTPLENAHGDPRYIGNEAGFSVIVTESHSIQNVFAVDESGRVFVFDIAAQTGVKLEDGKLQFTSYESRGVIDLRRLKAALARRP